MSGSESILNKEPEELTRLLLEAARQDGAPQAARERALLKVTSVALGLGAASSAAAWGTPSSLAKASGWLVAKWLVAGLTSGILTLAVAEKVQQLAAPEVAHAPANRSASRAALRAPRVGNAREQPSLTPQADVPLTPPAAVAELPPAAALASAAPVVATSHGALVASAAARSAEPVAATPRDKSVSSPLTRELALLEQARRALALHAPPSALQALNDYRAQFPEGSLQAEAAALRVEAVGQAGDRASAQRLARAFLASHPTSPLAARVRALSDSYRIGSPNP
ncbi:MAG: hypothetical protein ABJB12_10390 [Pseudomonadota bacterium]